MSEQRLYNQNTSLQMAVMTGQQPSVIVEKQSVRDIHITTEDDGRDVRKSINKLDEMDSGR
jgi:hypothetical protein